MSAVKIIFITLSLCFFYTIFCAADVVYLKNGRQMEGEILSQDERKVWIEVFGVKIGEKKRKRKEEKEEKKTLYVTYSY